MTRRSTIVRDGPPPAPLDPRWEAFLRAVADLLVARWRRRLAAAEDPTQDTESRGSEPPPAAKPK